MGGNERAGTADKRNPDVCIAQPVARLDRYLCAMDLPVSGLTYMINSPLLGTDSPRISITNTDVCTAAVVRGIKRGGEVGGEIGRRGHATCVPRSSGGGSLSCPPSRALALPPLSPPPLAPLDCSPQFSSNFGGGLSVLGLRRPFPHSRNQAAGAEARPGHIRTR